MSKGDCYIASAKYLMKIGPNTKWKLVHGIPTLQTDGKPFGHAWLEKNNKCLDVANGRELEVSKELYYVIGKIDENKAYKYTYDQMLEKLNKYEHWGPWESNPPR